MPEFCRVERDGLVITVTSERPEVMNGPYDGFGRMMSSEDFKGGPRGFVAKRKSRWQGR